MTGLIPLLSLPPRLTEVNTLSGWWAGMVKWPRLVLTDLHSRPEVQRPDQDREHQRTRV